MAWVLLNVYALIGLAPQMNRNRFKSAQVSMNNIIWDKIRARTSWEGRRVQGIQSNHTQFHSKFKQTAKFLLTFIVIIAKMKCLMTWHNFSICLGIFVGVDERTRMWTRMWTHSLTHNDKRPPSRKIVNRKSINSNRKLMKRRKKLPVPIVIRYMSWRHLLLGSESATGRKRKNDWRFISV